MFTSLPIHAAHPYHKGTRGSSDIYVSSCTPTLSALVRSRSKWDAPQGPPTFIAIGQPSTAIPTHPISDRQELDLIRRLSVELTELTDESVTQDATPKTLNTLSNCRHKSRRPFDSELATHGEHLTLLDIIRSRAGHAIAFVLLAAGEAAAAVSGDAPDDVIHFTAALQSSGAKNVVGPMWSVDDQVVHLVEVFYRKRVGEDVVFDPAHAARALRAVSRVTRDRVLWISGLPSYTIGA